MFECRHPALKPSPERNAHITLADCAQCAYRPRPADKPRALILKNPLSPGDVLVMTAAVHSLHKANPGKFVTAVDTSCPAVWENNPDVVPLEHAQGAEAMDMHYPLIQQSNQQPVHMLAGYCDWLAYSLKVPVPLAVNRPLVYLSEQEKGWINQVEEQLRYKGPFWILNAGVKRDYTAKQYPFYREVVKQLLGRVTFVQVGKQEHVHEPIGGAFNLLGRTDDRQLIRLFYHCAGYLGPTSFGMHLAAAFQKPAVVIAGGREPRAWNSYPGQVLLNSVGMLPCCRTAACWKSRTVPLGDGDEKDGSLCDRPVLTEPPAPECMASFSAEDVAREILRYRP